MKAKRQKLPVAVDELLSADTPRREVEVLWAALRSCFKTEDEAIAAVARNTGTILPCAPKPTTSTAALPSAIAHIRPTPRAPGAHTHRSTARIRPERAYKRPHLVLAARTRCWSTCSGRTAPSTSARRTRTAVRPEGARARERRIHPQRGEHGRLLRGQAARRAAAGAAAEPRQGRLRLAGAAGREAHRRLLRGDVWVLVNM